LFATTARVAPSKKEHLPGLAAVMSHRQQSHHIINDVAVALLSDHLCLLSIVEE